jgi:RNA polymerase sigma-70 factor (ECF subfamily)
MIMTDSLATTPGIRESRPDGPQPPPASVPGQSEAAFDHVVEEYREVVARLVYRLMAWSDEAEDVVQDVFVRALRAWSGFRNEADVGTWLTRIALNTCRSHRRHRMLRLQWLSEARRQGEVVDGGADQLSMDRETFDRVRQAVQRLPAKYREVVVLKYLEQMESDRITDVLGISANVLNVRLHRARTRLRDDLAELMES